MQNQPDIGGVIGAFELLREQLEETKASISDCAAEALRAEDFENAREWIVKAEGMNGLITQTDALLEQLTNLFGALHEPEPPTRSRSAESLDLAAISDGSFVMAKPKPPIERPDSPYSLSNTPLVLQNRICDARANYNDGSVVVLSGSVIAAKVTDSFRKNNSGICERRRQLRRRGELRAGVSDGMLVLRTDCRFGSPSGAACFVVGYATSGPRVWLVEGTRQSLGEKLNGR